MSSQEMEPAKIEAAVEQKKMMRATSRQKWLSHGGAVLLILLTAAASAHQIGGYDIWWHIANGQKYFHQFPNIFHDTFSYTFPGRFVAVNAFGGDLLLYGLYQFGEPGIVVGWCLLYALTVFFLFKACREMGVSRGLALFLCLFAYLALRIKHTYRPEVIAYLCFSAHIWVLIKAKNEGRTRLLWWSIGIYWIWGFCSSSAVFGLPMVVILLLDYTLQHRQQWKTTLLVFAFTCIAAFLNFAGWMMFRWFFSRDLGVQRRYISEYTSLDFSLLSGPLLALVLFWILMLVVLLVSFRTKFWRSPLSLAVLWVSVGLFGAGIRAIPFFVPASIPWLAAGVSQWKLPAVVERWLPLFVPSVGLFLLFTLHLGQVEPYGLTRYKKVYPERIRHFLDRYKLDGPLRAPLGYGGYFIHFRQGKTKVAVDGRNITVYPPSYMLQIYQSPTHPKVFQTWLKKYPTDLIMIGYNNQSKGWHHLLRRKDFVMVHWDRSYVLLVRRNSKMSRKIPKSLYYQQLDLTRPMKQFRTSSAQNRKVIFSDVLRALRQDSGNLMALFLRDVYWRMLQHPKAIQRR